MTEGIFLKVTSHQRGKLKATPFSLHISSFVQRARRSHPEGRKIMAIYKLFDRDRNADNVWAVSVFFGCLHQQRTEVKQKPFMYLSKAIAV